MRLGRWGTEAEGAQDDNSGDATYPGAGSIQEDLGVGFLSRAHQGPHLCLQQRGTYPVEPRTATAAAVAAAATAVPAITAASLRVRKRPE